MIKGLIVIPLLFCTVTYADHTPTALSEGPNFRGVFRTFYPYKKVKLLGELEFRQEENNRNYKALRLGGKYRLHRNLKLGAYFKRAYGLRHDDDWVKPDKWKWLDSESRGENLFSIEASARTLLNSLPGGSWVGEFRLQNEMNLHNDQNVFKLRPGLTYIWTKNGKAFINFYAQYEVYMPTNFSDESIYEKWAYLGSLYHFTKSLKFGVFYSQKSVTWTTSQTSTDLGNGKYSVTDKVQYLGIQINHYWK